LQKMRLSVAPARPSASVPVYGTVTGLPASNAAQGEENTTSRPRLFHSASFCCVSGACLDKTVVVLHKET
jgi:hypothetical protein